MSLYNVIFKMQLKDLRSAMKRIIRKKLWVLMICGILTPSSGWAVEGAPVCTLDGCPRVSQIVLTPSSSETFDFTAWDGLLKKYVKPTTMAGVRLSGVDYLGMKKDPAYSKLIADLKLFSPAMLKSEKDKLCFWINVYNIMAVKMVLDHYPVDSIKDVGGPTRSVWKITVGVVGGKEMTLHVIEHEILRKMGDPRIHAAIVCASVSCPDLRQEAYTTDQLDQQLDDQFKRFLANTGKGLQVDAESGRIVLSKIFDWFEEDFESRGGILAFLFRYAPSKYRPYLKKGSDNVSYLDYNWDLNKL